MNNKKSIIKEKISNICVYLAASGVLLTGAMFPSNMFIIYILGSPLLFISSAKVLNILNNNKIRNSIFSVSKNGKITQNALANPIHMIKLIKSKDKNNSFIREAYNMFTQLPKTNNKGKNIQYYTISHAMTYRLLYILQQNGYITNLNKQKYKKKTLLLEKIAFGNKSSINKKYQFYKISFELSNKKFDMSFQELSQYLESNSKKKKDIQNKQKPTNDMFQEPKKISLNNNYRKEEVDKSNIKEIEKLKKIKEQLIETKNTNSFEISEEVHDKSRNR